MKALAIDLGGSHATCAVVDERAVLAAERVPLEGAHGLAPALPKMAAALRRQIARAGIGPESVAGLALSFCGLVDFRTGRVTSTNQKYDDAPGIDLPAWCAAELGVPFCIENDARMALLGEWSAGAARGVDDVVMFTLGTGIGGAAMIEGRLLRGRHVQAGCLGGHFPVLFTGRRCTCGSIGCAEAEAAGWSLPLVASEWPGFSESALAREPRVDFSALFRHATAGDAVSVAIRDRCLQVWSANTVAAVHAYDPELVVYGGGVMASADAIVPAIERHVHAHAWTPWGKVTVRAAALGNDAALLGAVPLLREGGHGERA